MRIQNLKGIFSGESFIKSEGRRPSLESSDFIPGPVDISIDESGRIRAIGKNLPEEKEEFNGSGLFATPSFVDSHTHSLFSGERSFEFFMRWGGQSYQSISAAGGGIRRTMDTMENADDSQLLGELLDRLQLAVRSGITHIEVKSGYASSPSGELRLLRLLKRARSSQLPIELFSTFLGLHALPAGQTEREFVDRMISILPLIKNENLANFIDAFPEKGFFSLEESRRFVEAGQHHGLIPKIHADELSPLGSAETFARMGALSVDHLQKVSATALQELAQLPTVATLLPATSFFLGLEYAPARKILDAGARVALATDFNPGTAPDASPQFTMRLAAAQLGMKPLEIFCAFTYCAAAALGLEKSLGSLVPGYSASLCLWQTAGKDPLEEIIVDGSKPESVFLSGRRVY